MTSADYSPESIAREHLRIFTAGDHTAVVGNVTDDYLNHRSADEPAAARQRGPDGFNATLTWIARAFTDLRFEVHEASTYDDGRRVMLRTTLHGRQHGTFVTYTEADAGSADTVFPSAGKSFAAPQVHFFTIRDGKVAEHDAVRDDMAMAVGLGWVPPKPTYLVKMLLARRRERKT